SASTLATRIGGGTNGVKRSRGRRSETTFKDPWRRGIPVLRERQQSCDDLAPLTRRCPAADPRSLDCSRLNGRHEQPPGRSPARASPWSSPKHSADAGIAVSFGDV